MHRPSCWNGEMGGLFCPKLFRIAPCLNYSSKTKLIINISYLKHFVCSSQVRVKCSFQRKTYLLDSRSNSSPIHMYDWAAKRAETSSSWTSCVEARTISLMFACIKKKTEIPQKFILYTASIILNYNEKQSFPIKGKALPYWLQTPWSYLTPCV